MKFSIGSKVITNEGEGKIIYFDPSYTRPYFIALKDCSILDFDIKHSFDFIGWINHSSDYKGIKQYHEYNISTIKQKDKIK